MARVRPKLPIFQAQFSRATSVIRVYDFRVAHYDHRVQLPIVEVDRFPAVVTTSLDDGSKRVQAFTQFKAWWEAWLTYRGLGTTGENTPVILSQVDAEDPEGGSLERPFPADPAGLEDIQEQLCMVANGVMIGCHVSKYFLVAYTIQHGGGAAHSAVSAARYMYRSPKVQLSIDTGEVAVLVRSLYLKKRDGTLSTADAQMLRHLSSLTELERARDVQDRKQGSGRRSVYVDEDADDQVGGMTNTLEAAKVQAQSIDAYERASIDAFSEETLLRMLQETDSGGLMEHTPHRQEMRHPFHRQDFLYFACPVCQRPAWIYNVKSIISGRVLFCGFDRCALLGRMTLLAQQNILRHMVDQPVAVVPNPIYSGSNVDEKDASFISKDTATLEILMAEYISPHVFGYYAHILPVLRTPYMGAAEVNADVLVSHTDVFNLSLVGTGLGALVNRSLADQVMNTVSYIPLRERRALPALPPLSQHELEAVNQLRRNVPQMGLAAHADIVHRVMGVTLDVAQAFAVSAGAERFATDPDIFTPAFGDLFVKVHTYALSMATSLYAPVDRQVRVFTQHNDALRKLSPHDPRYQALGQKTAQLQYQYMQDRKAIPLLVEQGVRAVFLAVTTRDDGSTLTRAHSWWQREANLFVQYAAGDGGRWTLKDMLIRYHREFTAGAAPLAPDRDEETKADVIRRRQGRAVRRAVISDDEDDGEDDATLRTAGVLEGVVAVSPGGAGKLVGLPRQVVQEELKGAERVDLHLIRARELRARSQLASRQYSPLHTLLAVWASQGSRVITTSSSWDALEALWLVQAQINGLTAVHSLRAHLQGYLDSVPNADDTMDVPADTPVTTTSTSVDPDTGRLRAGVHLVPANTLGNLMRDELRIFEGLCPATVVECEVLVEEGRALLSTAESRRAMFRAVGITQEQVDVLFPLTRTEAEVRATWLSLRRYARVYSTSATTQALADIRLAEEDLEQAVQARQRVLPQTVGGENGKAVGTHRFRSYLHEHGLKLRKHPREAIEELYVHWENLMAAKAQAKAVSKTHEAELLEEYRRYGGYMRVPQEEEVYVEAMRRRRSNPRLASVVETGPDGVEYDLSLFPPEFNVAQAHFVIYAAYLMRQVKLLPDGSSRDTLGFFRWQEARKLARLTESRLASLSTTVATLSRAQTEMENAYELFDEEETEEHDQYVQRALAEAARLAEEAVDTHRHDVRLPPLHPADDLQDYVSKIKCLLVRRRADMKRVLRESVDVLEANYEVELKTLQALREVAPQAALGPLQQQESERVAQEARDLIQSHSLPNVLPAQLVYTLQAPEGTWLVLYEGQSDEAVRESLRQARKERLLGQSAAIGRLADVGEAMDRRRGYELAQHRVAEADAVLDDLRRQVARETGHKLHLQGSRSIPTGGDVVKALIRGHQVISRGSAKRSVSEDAPVEDSEEAQTKRRRYEDMVERKRRREVYRLLAQRLHAEDSLLDEYVQNAVAALRDDPGDNPTAMLLRVRIVRDRLWAQNRQRARVVLAHWLCYLATPDKAVPAPWDDQKADVWLSEPTEVLDSVQFRPQDFTEGAQDVKTISLSGAMLNQASVGAIVQGSYFTSSVRVIADALRVLPGLDEADYELTLAREDAQHALDREAEVSLLLGHIEDRLIRAPDRTFHAVRRLLTAVDHGGDGSSSALGEVSTSLTGVCDLPLLTRTLYPKQEFSDAQLLEEMQRIKDDQATRAALAAANPLMNAVVDEGHGTGLETAPAVASLSPPLRQALAHAALNHGKSPMAGSRSRLAQSMGAGAGAGVSGYDSEATQDSSTEEEDEEQAVDPSKRQRVRARLIRVPSVPAPRPRVGNRARPPYPLAVESIPVNIEVPEPVSVGRAAYQNSKRAGYQDLLDSFAQLDLEMAQAGF